MRTSTEDDTGASMATPTDIAARVIPADIPEAKVATVGIPATAIYGPRRYQIRFPDERSYLAARAVEAPTAYRTAVEIPRRRTIAIEVPALVSGPLSALQNETATLEYFASEYGAIIMEDYQYAMDITPVFEEACFLGEDRVEASLDDVVRRVGADRCRGVPLRDDVAIAVVDTGIDGRHLEFAESSRAGAWQAPGEVAWTDWRGHGTMCAAIAAGSRSSGGRYDGIAPGARLIACRTRFRDTELAAVYDYLVDLSHEKAMRIVATNSYGVPSGAAPPPPSSAFLEALSDAIAAGILVVFSAGNYHELTDGEPDGCEPTSIWQYKCRSDVLTVAACRLDGTTWSYSSRGPGELHGTAGAGEKPDVTAPTPANGAVLYGSSVRVLANGWGTSGAAPQAAGLAALLLSRDPEMAPADVFEHIRASAVPVSNDCRCEGRGVIDCGAALGFA